MSPYIGYYLQFRTIFYNKIQDQLYEKFPALPGDLVICNSVGNCVVHVAAHSVEMDVHRVCHSEQASSLANVSICQITQWKLGID